MNTWPERVGGGGGPKYIHRLQVIEEYIPEEYSDIYSSALYSSVT
jgi:hypothetical protein